MSEPPAVRSRWRRPVGWVLALAGAFVTALVTGLAGKVVDAVTAGPAKPAAPAATAVRFVRPFDDAGNLLAPYRATGHSTGTCWEGYESSDPESLRCNTPTGIYDPCWSTGSKAACLSNPWTAAAEIIDNPKIAAFTPGKIGKTPWALELLDPAKPGRSLRCAFAGGTGGTVAGMRINWGCFVGVPSPATYVGDAVGDPTVAANGLWSVLYVAKGSSDVRPATVTTVWH